MSDEDDQEQQVIKEPPREDPGKRFFVSHLNSYTGRAVLNQLKNDTLIREPHALNTFVGTLLPEGAQGGPQKFETIPELPSSIDLVSMERTQEFRASILSSDVIIYDLLTNKYEEVDYVIKTLKTADLGDSHKTLILLSSVMTWVNTPPKYKVEGAEPEADAEGGDDPPPDEPEAAEGEGENPEVDANGDPIVKKKPEPFKESDYHLRVPDENYQQIKTLETLAMSSVKTQPRLTVHVLCSGIRYGLGEGRLYELFKAAWLQNPSALSYQGKGENLIPTIHIIDLGRLVRRMVQATSLKTEDDVKLHAKQYIFAIDRTARPTQKNLITSISKGMGTGQVDSRGESAYSHYPREQREFLFLNLKMSTSIAFKDGSLPPDYAGEDAEAQLEKLKFPWHCQKGIGENIRKLNEEFNEYRGLHPVKIFLSGPPASGKTHYAERLSLYYNIPRVHAKEISDRMFALAKFEEDKGTDEGIKIKEKIDAIKDEMVGKYTEANNGEEPPEGFRDKLKVRLPDDLVFEYLRKRLTENDCRNRGYILDGFPRTYKEAREIFLIKKKKFDPEGNVVEEEEEPPEEGKEKSWDDYEIRKEIFPKSFILFDAKSDEQLLQRIKDNLSEQEVFASHNNAADMKRRIAQYRVANNSTVAEPPLKKFFEEQGVALHQELDSVGTPQEQVLKSLKIYIERFEKPFNYMTFDHEDEKVHVAEQKVINDQKEVDRKKALNREEIVEREVRKQKEAYTKQRLEQIKEYERDVLDQKSQPIRQYLMDNLVPILTEGLLEVCKRTPEDPVDYLAEYLFRRSLDVPYPDPTSY